MQAYEDKTGGDLLVNPHNGKLSNGIMFPIRDGFENGAELDLGYAVSFLHVTRRSAPESRRE